MYHINWDTNCNTQLFTNYLEVIKTTNVLATSTHSICFNLYRWLDLDDNNSENLLMPNRCTDVQNKIL